MKQPIKLITVGGSDSGGAVGIQADLRAWAVLGVYGMNVITAVTAQSSVAHAGAVPISAEFVSTQLRTILSDYGADALKTGYLGRADLIPHLPAHFQSVPIRIIDPVIVNYRGESMFSPAVTEAYRRHLLPLATVVTPNRHEAALLSEVEVVDGVSAEAAARILVAQGAAAALITGVPAGDEIFDLLYDGQTAHHLSAKRIKTINVHGSGDTLSAALAAALAGGQDLLSATHTARQFTQKALMNSAEWQLGGGQGPVFSN